MAMATERKFSRFATSDRSLQTREIPEGGICLSAFLVISQTGHPERILMGTSIRADRGTTSGPSMPSGPR